MALIYKDRIKDSTLTTGTGTITLDSTLGRGTKGFILGGWTTTNIGVSTADKLTFSTDTTAAKTTANFPVAMFGTASLDGNWIRGFSLGGSTGSSFSCIATASATDWATDVTAFRPSMNATAPTTHATGCSGTSSTGYAVGGRDTTNFVFSHLMKANYNAEVCSVIANILSTARWQSASLTEGTTKGYFCAGNTTSTNTSGVDTTDKITFSDDVIAAITTATLSQAKTRAQAVTNLSTAGYLSGGFLSTGAAIATTEKLTYSTDIDSAVTAANISSIRQFPHGLGSGATNGYFVGGSGTAETSVSAVADKLVFATEVTAATTTANLTQARTYGSAFSQNYALTGPYAGFNGMAMAGLYNQVHYMIVDGANWEAGIGTLTAYNTFTRDLTCGSSNGGVKITLSAGTKAVYGTLNSDAADYFRQTTTVNIVAGEALVANDLVCVHGIDGKAYKATNTGAVWMVGFARNAASANTLVSVTIYGIISGLSGLTAGTQYYTGTSGTITSTQPDVIMPIGVAISTSQLLINRQWCSAVTKGYSAGGRTQSPNVQAQTDKVDFATDVASDCQTAYLQTARMSCANLSNKSSASYYIGGWTSTAGTQAVSNSTEKCSHSTDVSSSLTVVSSQARRSGPGLTNTSVKGYQLGGHTGTAAVATTDKFTFSSEACAAQTTANLSAGRNNIFTTNQGVTHGYAMGGQEAANVTTIDKITFTTDTRGASGTTLSTARSSGSGLSSTSAGYAVGGTTGVAITNCDKITFSTDICAAFTTGNLTQAHAFASSISYSNFKGYMLGGHTNTTDGLPQIPYGFLCNFTTEITRVCATLVNSCNRHNPVGTSEDGV